MVAFVLALATHLSGKSALALLREMWYKFLAKLGHLSWCLGLAFVTIRCTTVVASARFVCRYLVAFRVQEVTLHWTLARVVV